MKLIFICLTLISLSFGAAAQDLGVTVPNAIFYNRNNSQFSTYNIPTGKKAFVFFFDATCGHCQKVVSAFNKRYRELANVNIYLISQDEYRSIDYFTNTFAKQLAVQKNVKVLQDRDHVFIMSFHPKQYPAMFLYGADKKLKFTSSDEKDVAKIFQLVKS
ncbi:peroxiredoxin family protein [Pedobacter hartonius]|uniref:AhpC/TSA family protein n=1 Tax=Pedobacter hartonius TaxID=425514 RepID=A0A1H3WNR9_9SPHI|nr:redoxin domain-containing protein [Pedobacter hartonius]SDZ88002.1 AhpC/TSA family protein [Pedobacter hartonius]